MRWGVDQARRAWVEPRHVLNTRSRDELLAWVAGKPGRRLTTRRTIARDVRPIAPST